MKNLLNLQSLTTETNKINKKKSSGKSIILSLLVIFLIGFLLGIFLP